MWPEMLVSVTASVVCVCSYKLSNIGQHRCLRVVGNSEQVLSSNISRRLVTMEKVDHYQACVLHTFTAVSVGRRNEYRLTG